MVTFDGWVNVTRDSAREILQSMNSFGNDQCSDQDIEEDINHLIMAINREVKMEIARRNGA